MPKHPRVAKTLKQKLTDLDDELFLLREHLHRLNESTTAHLKVLAAGLRALLCSSSGTEGLLWRLVAELEVSDEIHLHAARGVKPDHPLARGLKFAILPIRRFGHGDPRLPARFLSLRRMIKEYEAAFVSGKGLTHEYLIKAISQQMGLAHEDEGIEFALDYLNRIFLNGLNPYVSTVALDAELAIQIGERVLDKAEKERDYKRKPRPSYLGDVSVVVEFGLRQVLAGKIQVLTLKSHTSEVEIRLEAGPQSLVFGIVKRGRLGNHIVARYPEDWSLNTDAVFVFEYSSRTRRAHAITNGVNQDEGIDCDIGWLCGNELKPEMNAMDNGDFLCGQFQILPKLLTSGESLHLLSLHPDAPAGADNPPARDEHNRPDWAAQQ
jgi:hypothetical protein